MADNALDVRSLCKADIHWSIFAGYASLPVGGSFVLVNDHDRRRLLEEFDAGHVGSYPLAWVATGLPASDGGSDNDARIEGV
jgi:uncharacterized protein (DUF2249 family)